MDLSKPDTLCVYCGTDLEEMKTLRAEVSRYRGMISYAHHAPTFDSCKSILMDAIDGVSGADNYDEIKGERETLEESEILTLRDEVLELRAAALRPPPEQTSWGKELLAKCAALRARVAALEKVAEAAGEYLKTVERINSSAEFGGTYAIADVDAAIHAFRAALDAAKEPQLPCPHGRPSWKQCPHCLSVNEAAKEGK